MNKWLILLAMGIMILIDNIDTTAVNMAIPHIAKDFLVVHNNILAWISNGYQISATAIMVIAGCLADKYGSRRIFCIGVSIFLLASIGISYTNNILLLVIYRIIQGIGFSLTYPVTIVIIRNSFPKHQEGQAMGWVAGLTGFSVAIGPVLGSYILDYYNWRILFLLNLPLCLITLALTLKFVKKSKSLNVSYKLDYYGAITLIIGLLCIMGALNNLEYFYSNVKILVGTLLIGTFFLLVFLYIQSSSRNPILDLVYFKNKKLFIYATITRTLSQAIVMSIFFILPIVMQNILGFSIKYTGIILLPMTISMGFLAILTGKWIDKLGISNILLISILLMLLSCSMLSFFNVKVSEIFIMITLLILGISFAMHFPSMSTAALLGIPHNKINTATGIYYTVIGIGGTIGVAITAYILFYTSNYAIKDVVNLSSITPTSTIILKSIINGAQPLSTINNSFDNDNLFAIKILVQDLFFRSFSLIAYMYILFCFLMLLLYKKIIKEINLSQIAKKS